MLVLGTLALGCSGSDDDSQTVRVFAASSLTDVLDELEEEFEAANPGADIQVVLGGSSSLVAQAIEGAPLDVLATADQTTMDRAVEAGVAIDPTAFTSNRALVATTSNLQRVPLSELTLSVCDAAVPCGRAADELLADVATSVEPVSFEPNVRAVLTKLTLGEIDAGIVYASDLEQAGDSLTESAASTETNVVNTYMVAVVADATPLDQDFVLFLQSDVAQQRLTEAGFGPR